MTVQDESATMQKWNISCVQAIFWDFLMNIKMPAMPFVRLPDYHRIIKGDHWVADGIIRSVRSTKEEKAWRSRRQPLLELSNPATAW